MCPIVHDELRARERNAPLHVTHSRFRPWLSKLDASLRHLAAALRDQPRRALISGMDPEPAQRDAEAVAQPDQEIDVGDAPDPPREVSAQLDPAEIDHGLALADLRQAAGVLVAEWRQRAAVEPRLDRCGDIAALLLRGRCNAGDPIAGVAS